MTALPLAVAAAELGTSPGTLRRWVREEGCPAVQGGRGRGWNGYRVDPEAVRAWRASRVVAAACSVEELGRLALDFWRRGSDHPGDPGHRALGIRNDCAASLLAFFVGFVAQRQQREGELQTPEFRLLVEMARQTRIVHAVDDSVKGEVRILEKETEC